MTFRPLAFAIKYLLPLVAVLGIAYAGYRTYAGRPDDQLLAPVMAPAGASKGASSIASASSSPSAGTAGRVAGAGVIEPSSEVIAVAPHVSGVVAAVHVAAGEQVKRGQPLFTLDAREATSLLAVRTAEVGSLQRGVDVARAEMTDKQALLMLYQGISDERAMVREELLKRRAAVELAQARLRASQAQAAAAQAGVRQSRTQLDLLTVRAPLDATVLQLRVRPGEFASTANPVNQAYLTLGRTMPLHVRVDFDESDVSRLPLGQAANIYVRGATGASGAPSSSVSAQFVRAEPVISPKRSLTNAADERVDTRVLQVIYALPAGATGFFVGQQVDAFLAAAPAR